jgi:hypothetical protein
MTDETWKSSYSTKPDWWDDETEPRCDVCGIHTEEADEWCGECGNCRTHCEDSVGCQVIRIYG